MSFSSSTAGLTVSKNTKTVYFAKMVFEKMDSYASDLNESKKKFCGFKTRKAASLCIVVVFVCAAVIAASIAMIIIVPKVIDDADSGEHAVQHPTDPGELVLYL